MSDTSMADPGDGAPAADDQGDQGTDAGGQVIATICLNSDGSFTLFQGDEPEGGGNEDAATAAPADQSAALGAAPAVGAEGSDTGAVGEAAPEGEQEAPEGEHFDDVGQLMKAVLEIIKQAESAGSAGEDSNMESGFDDASGGAAPGITAQPPGM